MQHSLLHRRGSAGTLVNGRYCPTQVVRAAGLPAKDIVLVAPGTLPKTSSGKLQRSLCKERYVAGQLDLVSA